MNYNSLNLRPTRYANDVHWRDAGMKKGEVHGIPSLRGYLEVTDGILAVLVLGNEQKVLVHLDSFVVDVDVEATAKSAFDTKQKIVAKSATPRKPKVDIEDFV